MRIAIDCRWITTDTGGIRHYTLNLIKHLSLKGLPGEFYLIYDTEDTKKEILKYTGAQSAYRFLNFRFRPFSPLSQVFLPMVLNRLAADVFHTPNFMAPPAGLTCKKVVCVHDIIPYLFPEFCAKSLKIRIYPVFKALMKTVIERADVVVAPSLNTKNDILKTFRLSEDKVEVVYLGADERFKTQASAENLSGIRKKYGIKSKAILYAGRQDPSKNLINLIKAFEIARDKFPCQLIIAGKKDERYAGPYEIARISTHRDDIIFTGFVPGDELPLLFRACEVFAFPSLYEGFGLPPLEAMASGLPVISSNVSSLPEITGDAALMVDPCSTGEIADAMIKLLSDDLLRSRLAAKGIERAKQFSWESTASGMIRIYQTLCRTK